MCGTIWIVLNMLYFRRNAVFITTKINHTIMLFVTAALVTYCNATMGNAMPEMASCPLSVKGATGTVNSSGGAFRIDIKGDSRESSEEITRRAKALTQDK